MTFLVKLSAERVSTLEKEMIKLRAEVQTLRDARVSSLCALDSGVVFYNLTTLQYPDFYVGEFR